MNYKLSKDEKLDLIENLESLNRDLAETVEEIAWVCDQIDDGNARAYLVAPLQVIVESGSWVSRDLSLPQWIKQLREDEEWFGAEYL